MIDRALIDDAAGFELDSAQEALATIETHLAIRKADLARLKVTAPVSGIMIPPPAIFRSAKEDGKLPSWQGTPLEQQNIGAYLAEGVPICHVGDPGKLEAIIVIDQADIEFVRAGQDVELYLEGQPGEVITSKIEQVSKQDLQTSPRGLSNKAGGGLPTTTDAAGRERPMSITYQASAMLDDTDACPLRSHSWQGEDQRRLSNAGHSDLALSEAIRLTSSCNGKKLKSGRKKCLGWTAAFFLAQNNTCAGPNC